MKLRDIERHFEVREGYWFAPKLFGWGATPVTWQGWLLTLGFIAVFLLVVALVPGELLKAAVGLPLLLGFLWLVHSKTEGGFSWHWGPDKRR
ncbi:hypothetical protein [Sphingosinithalassobacter sp. LHW66-3]|uniref:hypothetical protein n=1 Tax=Sphingosinithalassobacter sp. LHW66-3 TaxID=3424718 RepID=UPI003D6B27B6